METRNETKEQTANDTVLVESEERLDDGRPRIVLEVSVMRDPRFTVHSTGGVS